MHSLRGFFVATSLGLGLGLCALAAAPGHAHAQSAGTVPGKEHAKRLFEEGVELEKKSDFAGALAKYKEAEQITVTPGLRFHTGYCLEMTGKLVAALDTYEAADKLARDQNKQDVRAAITARLDPLRARVPQIALRLAAPPAGTEVQLDGVTVGAPLLDGKSFRIEPGDHVVTARAPAHKAFSRKVQVVESATTSVDILLESTSSPTAAPGVAPVPGEPPAAGSGSLTEPPAERAQGRSVALPIATTAGAIVLAGAGIGLFLAADGAHSTAKSECLAQTTCDDRQSKIRTFDALALGSFVGAAGLGVLSVVLWTSKPADGASAARAGTRVVASPTAVGLAGSF